MAPNKPTAQCVGVQALNDFLVNLRPDWHFLPPVPSIEALNSGMEEGSITTEIDILLIPDVFYDPTGAVKTFEKFIAYMAPYCFLAILNYNPRHNEDLRIKVDEECYGLNQDASEAVYYLIDANNPQASLQREVQRYITGGRDERITALLSGRSYQAPPEEQAVALSPALSEEQEKSPYLGQITAITSSKGGSGKSTVADLVATYMAHASLNSVKEGLEERPLKICILDLDVRDGQQGFLTGHTKPTVAKLHSEVTGPLTAELIKEYVIYDTRLKVDLLLAPKSPRLSDDIPPEFYIELLLKLRTMYDFVILDTSVNYLDPLLERVAYPMADQIIFVTDVVINSVYSMSRWIVEVTRGMKIPRKKIAIVLNKTLKDVAMPTERLKESAMGLLILSAIPSSPKLITHAANMQQLNLLLGHREIAVAIQRIVRPIVANKYKLSTNLKV